jgi:aminoglycoside phosphotransferase (APT) family kinase protein
MHTDQPTTVRPDAALDLEKLNTCLQALAPGLGAVADVRQFPGGYSNLTYCLRNAEGQEWVLRCPPKGHAIRSAHDMGREAKVLGLLRPHYERVPKVLLYVEDEAFMGFPFYLMERLEGLVLRPANARQLAIDPAEMTRICTALVDNLALLHALDIEETGLAQLGKPAQYVQRQVEGWSKRYAAAATDALPDMEQLADWLPRNLPPEQAPAFLHNDYKYDNLMLHPQRLHEIVGVLDWEMSTVGDPLMDLGAALAYWVEADDDPVGRPYNVSWLPGNLSRRQLAERYAAQSGRDLGHILFYYAFGLFKNAVIMQQIYARWRQDHSSDPRFGGLMPMIRHLAEKAAKALDNDEL